MEVIQSGNTNMVRDLLNAGAKIDTKDAGGRTALMYAKDVSVINVLLENGANVNDTDAWGNTALFYASEKGDVEVVKTLLAAGADVNNKSNKSYQGLIWESHSFGSNRTEKLGGAGWTAIMVASREGKVEAVKELLNAGANVNNVSEDGWTALMAASLGNYPDVVRVLLQGKANVNYKNKRGQTALSFAPSEAMDRLFGGSGASVGVATLLKKAGAR